MSISEMNFKERSLLFAKLARIAYSNEKDAKSQAKKLGLQQQNFTKKKAHRPIAL